MRELEIQEQKEIEAVLASLSNQAAPYTEELRMDMELLAQLERYRRQGMSLEGMRDLTGEKLR